ncbi:MAG: MBL fold metallo-hydrolase [Rhodothermales bacterium]
MKRVLKAILGSTLLLVVAGIAILTVDAWSDMGMPPEGERLDRIAQSPQYYDGAFQNVLPMEYFGASPSLLWTFFTNDTPYRTPEAPLPVVTRTAEDFAEPRAELRVTWLGHSTLLVELDSARVLIDPVWGERASPFSFLGSTRFHAPPLALDDLPPVDAVLISHDHYDHLDLFTVQQLAERVPRWLVPLGLGSHLEYWGIPADRITELDWWDTAEAGGLTLVSTPARHFSGRSLTDRFATLWTGWAILGQTQRVFYSGDTSLTPSFADIGKRYGPFDLTLIESGAYNAAWADVHLGPEQAVAAHQMVRGSVLVPVHWGLFDLAMHSWTEPAERILAAAGPLGIPVALPKPGESITTTDFPTERWWPERPWQTGAEAPAVSSNLPDSVRALIPD